MTTPLTITIKEAAKALNAPKAVIERVADDMGLLIFFGNRKRIDPNDLPEIMQACRNKPKVHVSTSARTQGSTSSATPVEGIAQQALATAEKLKRRSGGTSRSGTAQPVPLRRSK